MQAPAASDVAIAVSDNEVVDGVGDVHGSLEITANELRPVDPKTMVVEVGGSLATSKPIRTIDSRSLLVVDVEFVIGTTEDLIASSCM